MKWSVEFDNAFTAEFQGFSENVQDAILAGALLLAREGPNLGRPAVDTLNGSRHANMKELRCTVQKAHWRIAFAFDPKRKAILLTAGNKTGANQKRFYRELIATADERFESHLANLERNTP